MKIPVPYTLHGDGFRHWVGTEDETAVGPNNLAILTLGWCYILSARLVEIYGRGAKMEYTDQQAPIWSVDRKSTLNTPTDTIDIGDADEDVLSWWLAILASNQGWKATVKQSDNEDFLAPWSIKGVDRHSFLVKCLRTPTASEPRCRPLSSSAAFSALAHFARSNNLGSQFLVAFTSAITIPTHNSYSSTVHLPQPSVSGSRCPSIRTKAIPDEWTALYKNLDYYITLSCNPETIMSSLCGAFWEPGVPCNLASPCLHPILNEILAQISDSPDRSAEIIAIICGIRRPSISALWLGAVATGLTPIILRKVGRGRPPVDPVAFPWTGAPQSFMDIAGTGSYCMGPSKDKVLRADVWRLLYLPTHQEDDMWYNRGPDTPWEPVGNMNQKNCSLRVASHLDCPRHQFRYQYLSWELDQGPVINDGGFSTINSMPSEEDTHSSCPSPEKYNKFTYRPISLEASEEASLEVFRWFVEGGEGFPPEAIYRHTWLDPIREDDDDYGEKAEDDPMATNTLGPEKRIGLEYWLEALELDA